MSGRNKVDLVKLGDVAIFYQHLYMDPKNSIRFNNGMTDMTLTMTDDMDILATNENLPDVGPMFFNSQMHVASVLVLIEQLETMPAIEFPDRFSSRWEEIRTITLMNLSLNKRTP